MNNEQNNNLNSGLNFMPTMGDNSNSNPSNQVTSNEGGFSVPGANLSPVGGIISPEPVVTTDSITNNNPTMGINLNNTVTNLENDLPNSNQNVMPTSPFNIETSSPSSTSSSVLNPTLPTANMNSQPQEMSMNESTMSSTSNLENSSSNNVPLTNESQNSNTPPKDNNGNVVSVGKYLGYMFLFVIPVFGFILLLIKAFGEKNDKNISNYAKAQLLFMIICVVASIILSIALSTVFGILVKNLAY